MTKTRVPTQKRSIEKREKIIKAGFDLFCEKGYYKTNTAEIAKYAGVSTGALYSYFELANLSEALDLSTFIEKWIEIYIDLYAKSNHALVQLRLVIVDDEEVNHHFSDLEDTYFSNIATILKARGIICDNQFEKIYISCILIDALRQEKTSFSHNGLNFETLKEQVKQNILKILSA